MTTLRCAGICVLAAAALTAGLSGCETTGEATGLGALIGAGLGAAIGADSGEALTGAIIGGVLGAAGGAIGHDVRRTRAEKRATASETYTRYEYEPVETIRTVETTQTVETTIVSHNLSLVFEEGTIVPSAVRRGNMVEGSMQYAVMGAGAGRDVTETRIIKRDGQVISQVSSKSFTRNDGTWVSRQEFRIPQSWDPGEYTLEQVVQSENTWVSGTVKFYVQ